MSMYIKHYVYIHVLLAGMIFPHSFLYTTGPVHEVHSYHSKSNRSYETSQASCFPEHVLYVGLRSLGKAGMIEAHSCFRKL